MSSAASASTRPGRFRARSGVVQLTRWVAARSQRCWPLRSTGAQWHPAEWQVRQAGVIGPSIHRLLSFCNSQLLPHSLLLGFRRRIHPHVCLPLHSPRRPPVGCRQRPATHARPASHLGSGPGAVSQGLVRQSRTNSGLGGRANDRKGHHWGESAGAGSD